MSIRYVLVPTLLIFIMFSMKTLNYIKIINLRASVYGKQYKIIYLYTQFFIEFHQCKTGCGFESHSRKWNILYFHFFALVSRQSEALSSTTHTEWTHTTPPEIGESVEHFVFKARLKHVRRKDYHNRHLLHHHSSSHLFFSIIAFSVGHWHP